MPVHHPHDIYCFVALLLGVLKAPFGELVRGRKWHPLGSNPAGVLLFLLFISCFGLEHGNKNHMRVKPTTGPTTFISHTVLQDPCKDRPPISKWHGVCLITRTVSDHLPSPCFCA